MIRVCSYCVTILGEAAPFDDPSLSHGLCAACADGLDRGDRLIERLSGVRALFRRLLDEAMEGNQAACAAIVAEAGALGLGAESILMALLQPALYEAGRAWETEGLPVAAEHRLTSWCEVALGLVPAPAGSRPPLDLLIFQAPGNLHPLGARIAARRLAAQGVAVEALVPELPEAEMEQLVRELAPRCVGFSCARQGDVERAVDVITRLRASLGPAASPRFILSGFAFRGPKAADLSARLAGLEVVVHLEAFAASLKAPAELTSPRGSPRP